MSWIHRMLTVANVSWRSSMSAGRPLALLVSLAVVPILDVACQLMLGGCLNSPALARIGYAGGLVTAACQVATVMASGMTMDREEEIIPEVLARRPMDLAYWIGLGLPGVVAASITGLVTLAGTLVLDVGHGSFDFLRALSLLPTAIFAGLALGILVGGLGLLTADSFAPLNAVTVLLPVAVGVVVPAETYPAPLRRFATILPLGATVQAVGGYGLSWTAVLLAEAVRGLVEVAIGLVASVAALRRIRSGVYLRL
ncbi:hypothetical protein [Bifidobacterium sp. ESL0820]|uniref:hypothetical protein n=1 Tax=Bifidobacterium sp. ESL0820 TaxID=3448586 RepID=UPI004042A0BE